MSSIAPEPAAVTGRTPTWGLGDVVIGLSTAIFGSNIVTAVVLTASGRSFEEFDDLPLSLIAITQVGLWLGLLGVPLAAAHFKGSGAIQDFKIRITGRDAWIGGISGALLQFPLLPLLYVPLLELLDKSSSELEGPARELTDRATDPFSVVMLVLIVGIGAPIVEEIFYRGLVQRSLLKRGMSAWPAILLTAALFAAMHLQLLQFPALFLFGTLAGFLAHRYDRLGPAIAAHVAFNMVTVVALLAA